MRQEHIICDHCGVPGVNDDAYVLSVEVRCGGMGADKRDVINGIDLCRKCYVELVQAIIDKTKRVTT